MYTKARRSVVAACAHPRRARAITATCSPSSARASASSPSSSTPLVGRVAGVDIDEDEVVTWEAV